MHELSSEAIAEYRRLWKEHHNREVSLEEAKEEAPRLLDFIRLLMRTIPPEHDTSQS